MTIRHEARPGLSELSAALVTDLHDLAIDLDARSYSPTTLALLHRNLKRSVPTALGAIVAVSDDTDDDLDTPVRMCLVNRVVEPDEIGSALLLPFPTLAARQHGTITLYAGAAAAFADLSRDLPGLLHLCPTDLDQDPPLPTEPLSPGIVGLQDFSLVNRALGILLGRGYPLAEARAELHRRATAAGHDLPTAAFTLINFAT